MEYVEKALSAAQPDFTEQLYVEWIGEDDTYVVVFMSSEELDKSGDAFECPIFAVNKKTGQETYNYMAGIGDDDGFENLRFDTLKIQQS